MWWICWCTSVSPATFDMMLNPYFQWGEKKKEWESPSPTSPVSMVAPRIYCCGKNKHFLHTLKYNSWKTGLKDVYYSYLQSTCPQHNWRCWGGRRRTQLLWFTMPRISLNCFCHSQGPVWKWAALTIRVSPRKWIQNWVTNYLPSLVSQRAVQKKLSDA